MVNINYEDVKHWGAKLLVIGLVAGFGSGMLKAWTEGFIREREMAQDATTAEVKQTFASDQTVYGPLILYGVEEMDETDTTGRYMKVSHMQPTRLNYVADAKTETLYRSMYEVNVYTASVQVSGSFTVNERMRRLPYCNLFLPIDDAKGLIAQPEIRLGGELLKLEHGYKLERGYEEGLQARFTLPDSVKVGDSLAFSYHLDLKGTESLWFSPMAEVNTLTLTSSHPHPSFQGSFLPNQREVRPDGFEASWKVMGFNSSSEEYGMGVSFINSVDPYQQVYRSIKYSFLIILLVFVACLLVEFLTKKNFKNLQYVVICASLVLFYVLLLSFSELMIFFVAYILAAAMTIVALTGYFWGILRSRVAYLLGALMISVYTFIYILLQMYSYAFLTGTLILFMLLCVIMFITASPALPRTESETIESEDDEMEEPEQATEDPQKTAEE